MDPSSLDSSRVRVKGLKETEEEFNNFMHKVTEVNGIVKKLTSRDEFLNEMGIAEADRFLGTPVVEEPSELTVKDDKTVINKIKDEEPLGENEMSKEAFMREVERDADKRYKDKCIRREKSQTLKLQANKAFRRGEYEKALSLYNKAIDFLKDSCVLYTNRALTYISLGFPEKAMKDCDVALRLNESSLKAWLYKAKCHHLLGQHEDSKKSVEEVLERIPEEKERIEEFVRNYEKERDTKN